MGKSNTALVELWNAGALLFQPAFQGGRLRSTVRLTESQQRQASLFCRKTFRNVFRDVSCAMLSRVRL